MADAKPAVERLSEDESLRGDLSDIGFGPLLDWAVAAVEKFAPQAPDADALDAYTSRVRGVVQSAVQSAQDSKLEDPNALLDFDPSDKNKLSAALTAVTFGDDPDDNAVQLAAALQSGLSAAAPATTTEAVSTQEAAQAVPAPAAPESTSASEEPKQEVAPAATEAAQPAPAPAAPEAVAPQPPAPVQEAAQPPQQEAVTPVESTPSNDSASRQDVAQPQKKKEEAGASVSPQPPPDPNLNPNPNPEPPQQEAAQPPQSSPSSPMPGNFLNTMRSTVGQAYNSAWGIFKGLSKRRSG